MIFIEKYRFKPYIIEKPSNQIVTHTQFMIDWLKSGKLEVNDTFSYKKKFKYVRNVKQNWKKKTQTLWKLHNHANEVSSSNI